MSNRLFTQFQWSLEKTPVTLFAAIGQGDTSVVTPVADVAKSLAGTFFRVKGFVTGTQYYFWFKVSGTGSDPANMGETGIEVDISTNATAVAVTAAVYAAAIANTSIVKDFTVTTPTTTTVTFVSLAGGCLNAHDGLSMYATGFAFSNTVYPVLLTAQSMGIKSVVRTGVGLYTITTGTPPPTSTFDVYVRTFIITCQFQVATGTPAAPFMFVVSSTINTNGQVNLKFLAADGTTATDPACGETIFLRLALKNSTAQ